MGAERDGGETLDEQTASGGAGFPNRLDPLAESCWSRLVAPQGGQPTTMGELLDQLDVNAESRSAALLQAMKRARLILGRIDTESPVTTKVEIAAADLATLTRLAMTRLR